MDVVVLSRTTALTSLFFFLSLSPTASALSRIVADQPNAVRLVDVREARAEGPTRTTEWVQAHIEGAPTHVAWIVSIPRTAAVDRSSTSWLDALEDATAPRVLPPSDTPPFARGCMVPPAAITITSGDASAPTTASSTTLAGTTTAVTNLLSLRQITLDPDTLSALDAVVANGDRVLVLTFEPTGDDMWTPPLRVVAEGNLALSKTDAQSAIADDAIRIAWLLAPSRTALPTMTETSVDKSAIHWLTAWTTDYGATRSALLSLDPSMTVVAEVATDRALTTLTVLPTNVIVPSAIDAYLARISTRGEALGDPATTAEGLHDAVSIASSLGESCPRGDIVPAGFACTPPAADSSEHALLVTGIADDFAFALAGSGNQTWVTRLVADAPLSGAPLASSGPAAKIARAPAPSWDTLCEGASNGGPNGGSVVVSGSGGVSTGAPSDGSGDVSGGNGYVGGGTTDDGSTTTVQVAIDTTPPPGTSSSCDGDSAGDEDSHSDCSCDGNGDDGGDASSGCSSGDGGGGEGCSGAGAGGGDCTIGGAHGGRKRVRVAKDAFLLALAALLWRRRTRR